MNALVPQTDVRPPMVTGGRIQPVIPQSMEDAYRLGKAIVAAGMAPRGMETPEKCMVAILRGLEVGLSPMQAVPEWQLDHDPALGLRAVDESTRSHQPHQHDIRFLVWRPRVEHAVKTTGRRGESDLSLRDGDQAKIAKVKRRDRKRAAEQAEASASTSPPKPAKPKRSMRGRPEKKLSPCRQPSKLAGLPRNTFTERAR